MLLKLRCLALLHLVCIVAASRMTPSYSLMKTAPSIPIRSLAADDFKEWNELIKSANIGLPSAQVSAGGVTLTMSNVRCTSFRMEDIRVQANNQPSQRATTVQLDLKGLDMVCYLDYVYSFIFTRRGTAILDISNSGATVSMTFRSPSTSGNIFKPSAAIVDFCDPDVQIKDSDFQGDIAAVVFDIVERLVRDKVEAEAEKRICEELTSLTANDISHLINQIDETLLKYPPSMVINPLKSETQLEVPNGVKLLDYTQHDETAAGKWLHRMLGEAVAFLTKQVEDKTTGEIMNDMNVNVLIRENFLDSDGSYQLDTGGAQLYYGHDRLTETAITLDRVKLFGLDTLTAMQPLMEIGKLTLQNELTWRHVRVELDVSVDIKPSTMQNSFVVNPSPYSVVQENIKVRFGVDDMSAVASIVLAMDQDKLGSLRLGSFLRSDMILPCFLSTLYHVEIGALSVNLQDIQPPTMEGFISRGLDRIASESVEAGFLMYEAALLEAVPSFFQTTVRDFVNYNLVQPFLANANDGCHHINASFTDNGLIDFRDLFLPPDQSRAIGGSGTEPYGNVVSQIVSEFKVQLLAPDEYGSPKVNEFIRKALSTKSDAAVILGDIVNTSTQLAIAGLQANLSIQVLEARVENLDSFGMPLKLMEPVWDAANLLNTTASIGVGSNDLRIAAKMMMSLTDGAGLQLRNEAAISLDVSSASIVLTLLVEMLEVPVFSVPLRDTLNANCWLTAIIPPSSSTGATGIQVLHLNALAEKLFLNVSCVSCTSKYFDDFLYDMYSPDNTGNVTDKIVNVVSLLLASDFLVNLTEGLVFSAAKQCPHSPEYDPNATYRELFQIGGGSWLFSDSTRDKMAQYFNIVNAVIAVFFIVAFVTIKQIVKRRHRLWLESLPSEAVHFLRLQEDRETSRETDLNLSTYSLFRSACLPRRVRLGVPLVLLVAIGLQLGGHLGVLSSVSLVGQIAGEDFSVEGFLEFRFFNAIRRAYGSGGSEMAILAFVFTGVWPYVKLSSSLAMWFLPPENLSVSRRGEIFLWLDVFAKLSVVDMFMMLIAVAAFLVYFGGNEEAMEEEGDFFSMRIVVQPGGAFYSIVMAQQITRVSSRFLLDCHQQLISSAVHAHSDRLLSITMTAAPSHLLALDEAEVIPGSDKQPKSDYRYSAEMDKESRAIVPALPVGDEGSQEFHQESRSRKAWRRRRGHARLRLPGAVAVGFAGLTILILAIIGCFLAPAISLNTKIVWGLLKSGSTFEEAVHEFTVFDILCRILLQARFILGNARDYIGLGLLLAMAIITATMFPAMKLIAFLRQWYHKREGQWRVSLAVVTSKLAVAISNPLERVRSNIMQWIQRNKRRSCPGASDYQEIDLLPAYRIKAFRGLGVYVVAFVIACWQLGAVAAYAIHSYCFFLEKMYGTFVYLGIVENSSAKCFGVQASSPSTVAILCTAFIGLFVSFLLQAVAQYRRIIRGVSPQKILLGDDNDMPSRARMDDVMLDLSHSQGEVSRTAEEKQACHTSPSVRETDARKSLSRERDKSQAEWSYEHDASSFYWGPGEDPRFGLDNQ